MDCIGYFWFQFDQARFFSEFVQLEDFWTHSNTSAATVTKIGIDNDLLHFYYSITEL